MLFRQLYDRRLSQYAYFIACQKTREAIVVDPQRDVSQYLSLAEEEEVEITKVAETHIHADFLSGTRELAERTGAEVLVSGEGGSDGNYEWVAKDHRVLADGGTFEVGLISFEVLHTPGHTPEHLSFVFTDRAMGSRPVGILTGDFVFVGDVGRPDLSETAAGPVGVMEPSARQLFRSIQRFMALPHDLLVWPGHGGGNASGKGSGAVPVSTVGYELANNPALVAAGDEEAFVRYILQGQPEPPVYFARMKRQNKTGPAMMKRPRPPKSVRESTLRELSGHTGVAVIDTRSWQDYRRAHLPGALFAPMNRSFNTVAGCYVPAEMPVYLIIEENLLSEAVTDLVHVGLDSVVGFVTADAFRRYVEGGHEVASAAEIDVASLRRRLDDGNVFLIDVRRNSELAETGYIDGAHNIVHTRLSENLDALPKDREILLYSSTGERSAYATGFLRRHGFNASNVAGGIVAWGGSGAVVVRG